MSDKCKKIKGCDCSMCKEFSDLLIGATKITMLDETKEGENMEKVLDNVDINPDYTDLAIIEKRTEGELEPDGKEEIIVKKTEESITYVHQNSKVVEEDFVLEKTDELLHEKIINKNEIPVELLNSVPLLNSPEIESITEINNSNSYDIDAAIEKENQGKINLGTEETGPLSSRIVSKNWLVRKNAYDELKRKIESDNISPDSLNIITDNIKNILGDSNVGSLASGLEIVVLWAKLISKATLDNSVPEIVNLIIEKCLTQRAIIVSTSINLLINISKRENILFVTQGLLNGCKNKKKKIPPECLKILKVVCSEFGASSLPIKEIIPCLMECFSSSDSTLKTATSEFACELYRWVRRPLRMLLVGLKTLQEKELFANFDLIDATELPTPKFVIHDNQSGKQSGVSKNAIDAFDLVAEVDLLSELDRSDFSTKILEEKWSTRVEGLKILITKAGTPPKIKNGDFHELTSTLVSILNKDRILQVQISAVNCLGVLGEGLRKGFSALAKSHLSSLLAAFKDKKAAMVSAVDATLDIYIKHCLKLSEVSEAINEHIDSANPQIQIATLNWIRRSLQLSGEQCCPISFLKPLIVILKKSLSAATPTTRDGAVDCISALVVTFGSILPIKTMLSDLEESFPHISKKLENFLNNTNQIISEKELSPNKPNNNTSLKKSPEILKKQIKVEVLVKTNTKSLIEKPIAPTSASILPSSSITPSTDTVSLINTPLRTIRADVNIPEDGTEMSFEEAVEKLDTAGIDDWLIYKSSFGPDAKWSDKQTAFDAVAVAVEKAGQNFQPFAEASIIWITKNSGEWKVSNVNILCSAFKLATVIIKHCAISKRIALSVASAAFKKLGDRKFSAIIVDLLTCVAERFGPTFVIEESINSLEKVKVPGSLSAVLDLQRELLIAFTCKFAPISSILKHSKSDKGLECSNALVRTSAINVLGELFHQIGPTVRDLVAKDLKNESILSSIDKRFAEIVYDPTIISKIAGKEKGGVNLDELNPRVDISSHITPALLKELDFSEGKDAWKARNAAMDKILEIIEKTKRIEFSPKLSLLVKALKLRLSDTNSNLKVKALKIIGVLSSAVGPKISSLNKFIIDKVLSCFSDNKKVIVNAAQDAMTCWVSHDKDTTSFQSIVPLLPPPLNIPSGRLEVLEWTLLYVPLCETSLEPLIDPTLECLQDRIPQTRIAAEKLLAYVINSCGPSAVQLRLRDLKPATVRSINPHIQAAITLSSSFSCLGMKNIDEENVEIEKEMVSTTDIVETTTESETIPSIPKSSKNAEILSSSSKLNKSPSGTKNINLSDTNVKQSTPQVKRKSTGPSTPSSACRVSINSSISNKPRSLSAPKSRTQSTSEKSLIKNEDSSSLFILKISSANDRDIRKKTSQKLKWLFDEPRSEFVSLVKEEMEGIFNFKFIQILFNANATIKIDSFDHLQKTVEYNSLAALTSNLDLILKWTTLQMIGRENTVSSTKQVEFLSFLFEKLKERSYTLDEYEASIFLPFLVEKLGHNKPRFKSVYQDIALVISIIFPPSKAVIFYLEGLYSKNMKTRVGVLEELLRIIREHGWKIIGRKGLGRIVSQCDQDDKDVKSSAIECIVNVWKQLDEDKNKLYEVIQNVSLRAKGILDEHFKYNSTSSSATESSISAKNVIEKTSVTTSKEPPSTQFLSKLSQVEAASTLDIRSSPPSINNLVSTFSLPTAFDGNNFIETTTKAVLETCKYFESVSTPHDANPGNEFYVKGIEAINSLSKVESASFRGIPLSEINKLLSVLTKLLWCAWGKPVFSLSASGLPDSETCFKYSFDLKMTCQLLSACMILFQTAPLSLTKVSIKGLFEFLLVALVDSRLSWVDETRSIFNNKELLKAINFLTLRIARNCNRTSVLISLLELVIEGENKSIPRSANHASVLITLINKVTNYELAKTASASGSPFDTVDCTAIMMVLHNYFSAYPFVESSSVYNSTAKNLFNQVVEARGQSIAINLMAIPSSSPLHNYLKTKAPEVNYSFQEESLTPNVSGNAFLSIPPHEELSNIFIEITKDVSSSDAKRKPKGIQKLYAFKKNNPTVDIEKHLSSISPDFLKYIRRELNKCEAEEKGESSSSSEKSSMTSLQIRLQNLRSRYEMKSSETEE